MLQWKYPCVTRKQEIYNIVDWIPSNVYCRLWKQPPEITSQLRGRRRPPWPQQWSSQCPPLCAPKRWSPPHTAMVQGRCPGDAAKSWSGTMTCCLRSRHDWTSTRLRVGRGYQVDKTTRDLRSPLVSQVPFFFLPWWQMIQSQLNVKSQRALTLFNHTNFILLFISCLSTQQINTLSTRAIAAILSWTLLSWTLRFFHPAPSAASCGATWQTSLCRSW